MKFQMKINDLFRIGEKTIFVGDAKIEVAAISNMLCSLEIDGKKVGELKIEGEVLNNKGDRDLWTKNSVNLDREILQTHDVRLISTA